jgi:HK97 family phage major capsid protein
VIERISVGSPANLADTLIDCFYTLKPEYRADATFVMSSQTLARVRKLKDANDQYLWQTIGGAEGGLLIGKPVITSEYLPSSGDVILVGDLRAGYLLTNIHQLKITVDNISTPGFYKWYVRQRVGGSWPTTTRSVHRRVIELSGTRSCDGY